jgi:ribosomal protein S18 acetylase RimI-like enzyme
MEPSLAPVLVRLAGADDSEELTDLAMRAKASWGYSRAFMDACRAELTMTPARMAAWRVWVAQVDQKIRGMIALRLGDGGDFGDFGVRAEVEDFFVDPGWHARGIGTTLMTTLLESCRSRNVSVVGLDADPNAESIYRRLGFVTVGRSPSRSIPGRTLPRMELRLDR